MPLVIHNLEIVIDKIRSFGGGARTYLTNELLDVMQNDVKPIWDKHTTLPALSKKELRDMDYPYSTRHGKDSGPSPDYDVHTVSGSLVAGTVIEQADVAGNPAVRMICTSADYEFIRYGTRYMRPRDPAGETLAEALPAIKSAFTDALHGARVEFFGS